MFCACWSLDSTVFDAELRRSELAEVRSPASAGLPWPASSPDEYVFALPAVSQVELLTLGMAVGQGSLVRSTRRAVTPMIPDPFAIRSPFGPSRLPRRLWVRPPGRVGFGGPKIFKFFGSPVFPPFLHKTPP